MLHALHVAGRRTIADAEVVFDLGDAPSSYGTRFEENGARHTVGRERSPRLGRFVDTEENGQPSPLEDDTPLLVEATGSSIFSTTSTDT